MDNDAEDMSVLRDDRLYNQQLAGINGGGNEWRGSMTGRGGHDTAPGPLEGADYDMYEDSHRTVAYAVQLAMQNNEEWLVEKALERIRRAHSEGQTNVKLSKQELEALERKRMRAAQDSTVNNQRVKDLENGAAWRSDLAPPPYPPNSNVYGDFARTTSASISPQSSATTLRSQLQPPFASSLNRPPALLAPSQPYPEDYQRMPTYHAPRLKGPDHPLHSPFDHLRGSPNRPRQPPHTNVPPQASYGSPDPAASAQLIVSQDKGGDITGPKQNIQRKRSLGSSGDETQMVEVIEHQAPNILTRAAAFAGRQPSSRS
ncbi:hypothetical protein BJX99DRAFT_261999 [Aspergillus californicus]